MPVEQEWCFVFTYNRSTDTTKVEKKDVTPELRGKVLVESRA